LASDASTAAASTLRGSANERLNDVLPRGVSRSPRTVSTPLWRLTLSADASMPGTLPRGLLWLTQGHLRQRRLDCDRHLHAGG
jgi:hypothetical protein